MKTRILFCRCMGAGTVSADVRERAGRLLDRSYADVTVVDDLCGLVAARDERLAGLAADGELIIMACHPRGVRWLLHAAGVAVDPERVRIVDLRRVDWAAVEAIVPVGPEAAGARASVSDGNAWFPVIDRDRCRNCRQCVDFCLFGVYTLDQEGRAQVDHPLNCKDNCPACARICPEVAIIFPKLGESPLDGDEIEDEALEQARVRVDVDQFLGDDVYAALKERRRKARERLLRKRADRDKALEERKRCSSEDDAEVNGGNIMIAALAKRFLTEPDPRVLRKFMFTFGMNGLRAVRQFQKRVDRGEYFPAFLFISVTNACNLSCQGCWITPTNPPCHMPIATLHRIVDEGRQHGCRFFGILGGEPLMYGQLQELFAQHPDCFFLLFTNGTLLNDDVARQFRDSANVSPLISIEGSEQVSDVRRGGDRVYGRTMEGVDACVRNGLITGVATSVCKSNIDDLASEDFLRELIARGVHYVWYYVYRPVGPRPTPELALSADEVVRLRQFMVEARGRHPIVIVDSYWDHEGRAMCPAATGIGYHISPDGYIEPCPPIQLAGDNIGTGEGLHACFTASSFLQSFRDLSRKTTRGCIIMEHPDLLLELADEADAHDSSGRNAVRDELARMKPCGSHHVPGREIPERHWLYRFAKKNWFFGFGAYG